MVSFYEGVSNTQRHILPLFLLHALHEMADGPDTYIAFPTSERNVVSSLSAPSH